jgi:hypothetical protein
MGERRNGGGGESAGHKPAGPAQPRIRTGSPGRAAAIIPFSAFWLRSSVVSVLFSLIAEGGTLSPLLLLNLSSLSGPRQLAGGPSEHSTGLPLPPALCKAFPPPHPPPSFFPHPSHTLTTHNNNRPTKHPPVERAPGVVDAVGEARGRGHEPRRGRAPRRDRERSVAEEEDERPGDEEDVEGARAGGRVVLLMGGWRVRSSISERVI